MAEEDIPIPGPDGLTESVRTALQFAASQVEREVGTSQGCTALYWALHAIVMQHTRKKQP